jgi:hypothetical protein
MWANRVAALAIGAIVIASCGTAANQPTVAAAKPDVTVITPSTAVAVSVPTTVVIAAATTTAVVPVAAPVELTVEASQGDDREGAVESVDIEDDGSSTQPASSARGSSATPAADHAIAAADRALAEADALLGADV